MRSVSFPTPLSSRYPIINACPGQGELAWYGPSRSSRRPIPPFVWSRVLSRLPGAPHRRERTRKRNPHRARCRDAASHRSQAASRRKVLLQGASLQPQIDGTQIRLIGEVNDEAKQPFLAGAAALLFPIDWPEPFGLVMIEAMACGTPVIAFRSGSVPEVIDEGVTGFVVDDEEQAVQAVKRLGELDRRRVRERFEERFTAGLYGRRLRLALPIGCERRLRRPSTLSLPIRFTVSLASVTIVSSELFWLQLGARAFVPKWLTPAL